MNDVLASELIDCHKRVLCQLTELNKNVGSLIWAVKHLSADLCPVMENGFEEIAAELNSANCMIYEVEKKEEVTE